MVGHFQGANQRVVERFTFVNANAITYQATIEDPQTYTQPWTMTVPLVRVRDKEYELMENACYEGNTRFIELLDTTIR